MLWICSHRGLLVASLPGTLYDTLRICCCRVPPTPHNSCALPELQASGTAAEQAVQEGMDRLVSVKKNSPGPAQEVPPTPQNSAAL